MLSFFTDLGTISFHPLGLLAYEALPGRAHARGATPPPSSQQHLPRRSRGCEHTRFPARPPQAGSHALSAARPSVPVKGPSCPRDWSHLTLTRHVWVRLGLVTRSAHRASCHPQLCQPSAQGAGHRGDRESGGLLRRQEHSRSTPSPEQAGRLRESRPPPRGRLWAGDADGRGGPSPPGLGAAGAGRNQGALQVAESGV